MPAMPFLRAQKFLFPFYFLFIFYCLSTSVSCQNATSPPQSFVIPSVTPYRAHGWLMWIAFGVLFPIAILVPRFGQTRTKRWFEIHMWVQVIATCCATASLIIALVKFDALGHFTHANLGLAIVIMVWLQVLIALFARPKKGSKVRQAWYFKHWLFGMTIVILGWFNIFKGLDLYVQSWSLLDGSLKGLYIAFSIEIAILSFIYLFLGRWTHYTSQSRTYLARDDKVQGNQHGNEHNDFVVNL